MDIAWLIIDSLSFDATPFGDGGPATMPNLAALADEHAVSFMNAYVPGPTSPSSHGSFLTGELPSVTGMHEAHPFFDGSVPTIAEALADTHQSFMISANPFIFNGLHRGFDEIEDLKTTRNPLFSEATDPITFNHVDNGSGVAKLHSYLFNDGKPLRSVLNAVAHKIAGQRNRTEWRLAETISDRVREFLNRDGNRFAIANYMEVHPPLDASNEALDRWAKDYNREELPIGVEGSKIYERIQSETEYEGEDMYALYLAAIWDIDQHLGSLMEDLIAKDTFIIVTADHGNWFRRDGELDEERIHVPLLVFDPNTDASQVSKTVNIRSLPRTTLAALDHSDAESFSGTSLLDVVEDQRSITEFIHNDAETSVPVTPSGKLGVKDEILYKIAAIKRDARVDFDGEQVTVIREDSTYEDELRATVDELRESNLSTTDDDIDYDESTQQRLEDLGYL
jgi:hypothetical protein